MDAVASTVPRSVLVLAQRSQVAVMVGVSRDGSPGCRGRRDQMRGFGCVTRACDGAMTGSGL